MSNFVFQSSQMELLDGSHIVIAKILGSIDGHSISQFKDAMMEFYNNQPKGLILNLSGIKDVNSEGMVVLLELFEIFREIKCKIQLDDVPEIIKKRLRTLGLDSFFEIYNKEPEDTKEIHIMPTLPLPAMKPDSITSLETAKTPAIEKSIKDKHSVPLLELPQKSFSVDIPFNLTLENDLKELLYVYNFNKNIVNIGRGKESDVCILDRKVSRQHAQIERIGDIFILRNLQNHNNTSILVDGRPRQIKSYNLKNGDVINLSKWSITFFLSPTPG